MTLTLKSWTDYKTFLVRQFPFPLDAINVKMQQIKTL